jgi:hypothetical protein
MRSSFLQRAETFGLDTERPWAMDALRLIFSVPRAYADLVAAWEHRFPGTRRALDRLVELGFVAYQPGVIIDTVTGDTAAASSRVVARWRMTSKGRRMKDSFVEDLRTFEAEFPRTKEVTITKVVRFYSAFDLAGSHAKYGMSVKHALALSGMEARLGRWWLARFLERGWIVEIPDRYADVREVVPEHWRVTRSLCRQLDAVIGSFPTAPDSLRVELRLKRSRFLDDIDPARVGLTGATDFDHDVCAQQIVAAMLRSERCAAGGMFAVEPRLSLPMDQHHRPWRFVQENEGASTSVLSYQPDAILTAQEEVDGKIVNRRVVVEYERFQSRRDAWSHIERFLGWLHTRTLPFEQAVLCFIVDSEPRKRTYVELIEAFCDHALDHPEMMVANPVVLAVAVVDKVVGAADALNVKEWSRIALPRAGGTDTAGSPVLHAPEASPYDAYFGN